MCRLIFVLMVTAACIARGEMPPRYATSERIVTIEQWGGRGQVATVWAVRPTQIVVYSVEGSEHDKLLRVIPIEKKEAEKIRRLVVGIDAKSRGKVWYPKGYFDGIMLRISFTEDGSLRDDRIEIENHWRSEFAELVSEVSMRMPTELKISFKEKIESSGAPHGLPIESISVKDYYRTP